MMKKNQDTDKRIKRSKDALKKATLSLMKEKELRSISITEIAERADFNRGTFYAHYKSKEDLLNEVVKEKMNGLIETLSASHVDIDIILSDEVPHVAISLFNHFWENGDYYQLMLCQNVSPGFQDYLCETINNHFLKNIQTELANPNHHINHEIHSYYAAYSILGILVYWFRNGLKYTPQYMAEQLVQITLNQPYKVTFKVPNRVNK
ncbi:TetR/AcrR family transcriptional regulator [Priestia megaterium]|uniref:TetR/AcrR family transcriptional regulator n=2 Tax=Priestia megaterium TaxID=1404 RepID=UPI000BEE670C|nr:TetR/AcrR family transcriptional regulator [Priestia megaterium]PED63430.1 hypothetical protein CON20_26740 [Priestia megaterium]PEE41558.1 hypothetical protein COM71_30845 [Priestia megaterium]PEX06544.1 hypothetical protein CN451_24695 [Priestia megaterium]PFI61831.1 hypothetical protein COI68_23490 [Priestia megaterium]PFJ45452.1 hypothetical protein COJ00_14610 [Priestia megaterium]